MIAKLRFYVRRVKNKSRMIPKILKTRHAVKKPDATYPRFGNVRTLRLNGQRGHLAPKHVDQMHQEADLLKTVSINKTKNALQIPNNFLSNVRN